MKKALVILITLFLIPSSVLAKAEALKGKINVANVQRSEIVKQGTVFSTTAHVTMLDGNEYIIPVTFDRKNLTATFSFASGKTAVLTLAGMVVIEGEGYQEYDDVANSTSFFETYLSNNCLLNILAYLIFPYPIDLIFLYFIIVTCF
jgi:hypothetical protein